MKNILKIIITIIFFISLNSLLAQGPPTPPADPNSGGGPIGGSAPLGEGTFVLFAAAALWSGRKIYHHYRKQTIDEMEN